MVDSTNEKAASFWPAAFLKLTICEENLLLVRVFFRIALLANLVVLLRFNAALVRAFFPRLLGVIAAARARAQRAGEKA